MALSAILTNAIAKSFVKKNYIINGAMMISQENGTTAGTTSGYYPVDQWAAEFTNGGAISVAQVASATPAGSPNRVRVTVTAADASVAAGDYLMLFHNIEGLRAADLLYGTASVKTVTMQFGVKAPAGTYCVVISNSAFNRSYVAEYTISGGEANTDVIKSVTIPGDVTGTWLKDNGLGIRVRFGLMAGSTFQQAAGSWGATNAVGSSNQFNFMGTLSNVFELFDVSLTEGRAAPAFQMPDYSSELYDCQRYYETGIEPYLYLGGTWTSSYGYGSLPFKVKKRAAPTMAVGTGWMYWSGSSAVGVSLSTITGTVDDFNWTAGPMTNWNGWFPGGTWKANARL